MSRPMGLSLVGIVAYYGGYTVHFEKQGNMGGMATRGNDLSVFAGCRADLPILRFDLLPEYNVKDPPFLNGDYYNQTMYDPDIRDTEAWIAFFHEQGVPVTTLRALRKEVAK